MEGAGGPVEPKPKIADSPNQAGLGGCFTAQDPGSQLLRNPGIVPLSGSGDLREEV